MEKRNKYLTGFMIDYNKHRDGVGQAMGLLTTQLELELTKEDKIELFYRQTHHDDSKLSCYEEFEGYIKLKLELDGVEYGSKEYDEIRKKYDYVISLHYKNNDHHPEHFKNGYADMTKLQKYEMICDWIGAMIARNSLDKYEESCKINKERFNIPDNEWEELYSIIEKIINKYKEVYK